MMAASKKPSLHQAGAGIFSTNQWIGFRENPQETTVTVAFTPENRGKKQQFLQTISGILALVDLRLDFFTVTSSFGYNSTLHELARSSQKTNTTGGSNRSVLIRTNHEWPRLDSDFPCARELSPESNMHTTHMRGNIHIYIYIFTCSIRIEICMYVCMYLSVCLSACLPIYPSIYLSIYRLAALLPSTYITFYHLISI